MDVFPLVSIVTPTYNQASYLAETIESVLAQDYPNVEYIVIDDGSTDSTTEVLSQYDGRIFWERHENIGQVRTLNKAWSKSKGAIIGYLSSDDILYPNAIRKLVDLLVADDLLVCVFPNSDLIDSRSRIIKKNICLPFDLVDTLVKQECYIGPGALFKRDAFDIVGGWKPDLKLAPDREFWVRLAALGKFRLHSDTLAGYRMHSKSISYKDVDEETGREYLRVLDQYFSQKLIPDEIILRKSEAYGYAYLLLARNCFRAGQVTRGKYLYNKACQQFPPLGKGIVKLRLMRYSISKPVRIGLSALRSLLGLK